MESNGVNDGGLEENGWRKSEQIRTLAQIRQQPTTDGEHRYDGLTSGAPKKKKKSRLTPRDEKNAASTHKRLGGWRHRISIANEMTADIGSLTSNLVLIWANAEHAIGTTPVALLASLLVGRQDRDTLQREADDVGSRLLDFNRCDLKRFLKPPCCSVSSQPRKR